MSHFQSSSFETTLDIESLICLTAVQDRFVTSDLLGNIVQRLYDPQPQLFPLLILVHRDVFNVSDSSHVVYELAFDNHGACAYHSRLGVANDQNMVGIVA